MDMITEGMPIGIALAIVLLYVLDRIVAPLIKGKMVPDRRKNGDGSSLHDDIKEIKRMTEDLHNWHAPNEDGRQSWKDQAPVIDLLKQILEELKRWNDREDRREAT